MKRPSPATVLAAIALFIVIGGTATAAGLINGKKIKPGTVTAKQIKNKTITSSKLSPSTVSALKGAQGPRGATGPAGVPGKSGATGPAGAVDPFHDEAYDIQVQDFLPTVSLDLPAGTYVLMAKANMTSSYNGGNNYLSCAIWTDDTDGVDVAAADATFNRTVNLSMMAVSAVADHADVRCDGDSGASVLDDVKLIATPVAG